MRYSASVFSMRITDCVLVSRATRSNSGSASYLLRTYHLTDKAILSELDGNQPDLRLV